MPTEQLASVFRAGRSASLVNGFAIGRTIFGDVAQKYFAKELSDDEAVEDMATIFSSLIQLWDDAGDKT